MDININPVSGATQSYKPPIPTTTAKTDTVPTITQPQAAQEAYTNTSANQNSSESNIQQQHLQALQQASLSFKNVYALGDQSFAIFKDSTGQYITRYVSLRDGSITYVPQPVLVRHMDSAINPALSIRA